MRAWECWGMGGHFVWLHSHQSINRGLHSHQSTVGCNLVGLHSGESVTHALPSTAILGLHSLPSPSTAFPFALAFECVVPGSRPSWPLICVVPFPWGLLALGLG
jgi:hypothetical protein